jgi:site-specific DNA-methyltransferase (adenine-specific)
LLRQVFTETYRVLVNGGRACVNVANLGRRPYLPLSDFISQMMLEIGFQMRGEIIWHKGAGAGVSMAWGSWQSAANPVLRDVHEYILVFSKGSFSRKKQAAKENTISKEQFMEWTKSVWTMSPESAKKVGHPAPFPVELPFRLIQLYTFSGDTVLDPFMGSGTTAVAALQAGRKYVGYETDPAYVKLAEERIACYEGA